MKKYITIGLFLTIALATILYVRNPFFAWSEPPGGYSEKQEKGEKSLMVQDEYLPITPTGKSPFVKIAKRLMPTVVSINTEQVTKVKSPYFDFFEDPFDFFKKGIPEFKYHEQEVKRPILGSGVIVSENGYILTNNHMIEKAGKQGRAQNVLKALALSGAAAMPMPQRPAYRGRQAPAGKQLAGGRRGKPTELPVWLRGGDLRLLNQMVIERPERLLITLDRESLKQLQQQKKSQQHLLKSITWILPPVILEDDVPFYRQSVTELVRQGFRQWMVGHIGQLQLFRAAAGKAVEGGRRHSAAQPELCGDYTLNVMNSLAVGLLREMGVATVLLSIEADREALQKVCAHKKKSRTGLVVFGRPPLFTARLQPDFFQFNKPLISPRGERFELVRKWGQTLALPDKPFSLYSQVAALKEAGFDFVLVDLSFVPLHKKEMAALRKTFATKGRDRSVDTFNFFRTLQ